MALPGGTVLHAAPEPSREQRMLDRMMNPDRQSKSTYQGKTFDTGSGYAGKVFQTGAYGGTKEFESRSFFTKAYDGARQSWMGKMLFPQKKLPENLQGASRDDTKQFSTQGYAVKDYQAAERKSSYGGKDFPTKTVDIKGKAQGSIDNDQKLQEAVKKGLSIDDVRKLLNKAP